MHPNPLVVEVFYPVAIEQVWTAITRYEAMKQWYFDVPGFTAEPGCAFSFAGGPPNGPRYIHLCTVMEVLEPYKLSYTWRYDGYEGNTLVTFELFTEENGTRLRLTHEGLHSFPESNPDLARHNFETGWQHIIGTSLFRFLTHSGGNEG